MFKSISWHDYLVTLSAVSLSYYAIITGIFFSRDLIIKRRRIHHLSNVQRNPEKTDTPVDDFMGSIRKVTAGAQPTAQSIAAAEDVTVAPRAEDPLSREATEIIERLGEIFSMMSQGTLEKERYLKSIRSILTQYPKFKGTPVQVEVANFICNYFNRSDEISFSNEEIDHLWPCQEI